MGVGRRADDDGVDVFGFFDGVDGAHLSTIGCRQFLCRLLEGIGYGNQFGLRVGADGAGVDLANTAGTEEGEANSHGYFL